MKLPDRVLKGSSMGEAGTIEPRRRQFLQLKIEEFEHFTREIAEDMSDANIKKYLRYLFYKIYHLRLSNKFMYKSQACRYVPLAHSVSCQKYMEEAKRRGYVDFATDDTDKRKQIIKPGDALIDYVKAEIDLTMALYEKIDQGDQNAEPTRARNAFSLEPDVGADGTVTAPERAPAIRA
jgi:hypothetical protein